MGDKPQITAMNSEKKDKKIYVREKVNAVDPRPSNIRVTGSRFPTARSIDEAECRGSLCNPSSARGRGNRIMVRSAANLCKTLRPH
jgi:hypothetical protein